MILGNWSDVHSAAASLNNFVCREQTACGTVIPSALVDLLSITSSSLVDCSNGISAGFSPLRI